MANPLERWKAIKVDDRAFLVGTIVAPIAVWWFYFGRKKYGTKGLK